MGKTLPLRVISPVMATSFLTGTLKIADTREVTMATPAEGPSLGMAPFGDMDMKVMGFKVFTV